MKSSWFRSSIKHWFDCYHPSFRLLPRTLHCMFFIDHHILFASHISISILFSDIKQTRTFLWFASGNPLSEWVDCWLLLTCYWFLFKQWKMQNRFLWCQVMVLMVLLWNTFYIYLKQPNKMEEWKNKIRRRHTGWVDVRIKKHSTGVLSVWRTRYRNK